MKLKGIAALYMQSPEWGSLSPASRRIYLSGMKAMDKIMKMEANMITRPVVIDLRDELYDKPATCRIALTTLNNILRFGYDRGHCEFNHAQNVRYQPKAKPIPRWSDDEIALFMRTAPDHLRAAFALTLFTGQRRSDVIRMQWLQYDGSVIKIMQKKTGRFLRIPVHPQLEAELIRLKKEHHTDPYILHNAHGEPYTAHALTTSVSLHAKKVGINGRSIHGLRKTAGSILAELGCSPHYIASILGHKTLRETTAYSAEADQLRMAMEAMKKWTAHTQQSASLP